MRKWGLFCACVTMIVAGSASAQRNPFGIDIGTPSTDMWKRIEAYTSAYADRIGIGDPYWQYCHIKLTMSTANEPTNGLPPYGVNYNTIRNDAELKKVIDAREAYEKSYLVLCLADTKRILNQAEAK